MILYSKKVVEHFTNPKYFGTMKNPDALGEVGNIRCGDIMKLYLKIDKKTDKIMDIKFETLGCAAAIATSDMICGLVIRKTLDKALKVKFEDISMELGELPPIKVHCAVLATQALKKAIENYRDKNK